MLPDPNKPLLSLSVGELMELIRTMAQELHEEAEHHGPTTPPDEYLDANQMMLLFHIKSRTTLTMWEKERLIPRSILMPGSKRSLWRKEEVMEQLRPQSSRPPRKPR